MIKNLRLFIVCIVLLFNALMAEDNHRNNSICFNLFETASFPICGCNVESHKKNKNLFEEDLDEFTSNSEMLLISLGDRCLTAFQIKFHGWRVASFPFDWNITKIQSLFKILRNDFNYFLDVNYLTPHPLYHHCMWNVWHNFLFAHDFPTTGPTNAIVHNWKQFLPEVQDKYKRRIDRFNDIAKYKGKVFFIRSVYPDDPITPHQAIILRNLLSKKFPLLNFELIIIEVNQQLKEWKIPGIKKFNIELFDLFSSQLEQQFNNIFTHLGIPKK